MTTFKVTYQGTLRRFTIATNINWFDLEFKLRTIFSIPSSLPIFLSYTDEDGDLITFSSDTELQEILAQQDNTAIFKFTLFTVDGEASENASIQDVTENIRSGVSSLQLEERQTVEPQQQMQEESRPPSYYHTTVTDDADDVFFEKGKEKEGETSATASSNTTTGQEQQQESQPPFDFTEQFQLLLTQFQDVLDQNPQILETARNVVENIHRVIPADIDIWAQWLNSLRSDGPDNKDSDPSFYVNMTSPWHRTFYSGQYGPQGGIYHGCPRGAGFAGRCGGRPSGPPGAAEHERSQFGHSRGGFGGCRRGGAGFFGCHRGGFGVPYSHRQYWEQRQRQQQNTQEKITPEQIQEKIQLLHEMGYWEDDAQNEDLLTRYNGNLERVIEILVQRQSERERTRQQQQQQRQETSTDQHMEDAAKESPSPYNL